MLLEITPEEVFRSGSGAEEMRLQQRRRRQVFFPGKPPPVRPLPKLITINELDHPWDCGEIEAHTPRTLIAEITHKHGLASGSLAGRCKRRHVVAARDEAILAVFSQFPEVSLKEVSRLFGRDHASIWWSLQKSESAAKREEGLKRRRRWMKEKLGREEPRRDAGGRFQK